VPGAAARPDDIFGVTSISAEVTITWAADPPGIWQRYAWLLERSDLNFCRLSERLQFMIMDRDGVDAKPQTVVDKDSAAKLDAEMRTRFKLPPREATCPSKRNCIG
jgi:hypothetical protein